MKKKMNKIILSLAVTISIMAVVAASAVASFISLERVDRYLAITEMEARSEAIDGCGQVSINTFTTEAGNQQNTITDLNQTTYQKCLELKGISK